MFDGGAMRQRVQFVGTEEHMQRMGVFGAAVVLIGLVLSAALSGQPVARAATLDDLLVELRGLRADLKATSAASVRAQALVARAALQEQRLRAVSEQLNRVQSQLSAITMEREEAEEQLRDFVAAPVVGNPMNRDEVIAEMKRRITRLQATEGTLHSQVGQLSGVVSQQQVRWEEVNRRVEAMGH